tara:strand:- start:75 stop:530 length:456 start_codon:yes stop_codon:yes gene_type:complete
MWSHYADSHRGFCVKFDTTDAFFNSRRGDKDEFYHLRKVEYLLERPNKSLINMSGIDLLLLKSDIWSYEKEWRFCGVLNESDSQMNIGSQRIYLFKYPKQVIREIILGVNATSDLEDKIRLIISENSGLSHVKLIRAKISETCYSLEFNDL